MIVHSHSRSRSHSRRLIITLLALTTLLGIFWLNTRSENNDDASWRQKLRSLTVPARNSRRVTKVSMLYGSRNTLYERALQSHRRHAERWGYGMEVLQNDIAVGYWNKPSYLLSLVIEELAKPVGEQVEWFMWVDADTVVINPAIPLEIFLPPFEIEDIHMIATKDHKGLNTGIFFLRVHQKTVDILIKTLGYPIYNPKVALGVQVDQTAMEKVLSQPALKNSVMYLPRTWINTYEWAHAYEGERGNFLVHFPGLGDQRWAHMDKWLDIVEQTPEAWEVPVNETWYLDDSSAFWGRVLTAKKIIWEHEKALAATKGPVPMSSRNKQMERAVGELQKVLSEEPYSDKLMDQRIKDCNLALERR